MSFVEEVRAQLPGEVTLPDAFATTFAWAESQGFVGQFPDGERYLSLYPPEMINAPGASYLLFHADGPPLADPVPTEITQRYASIASAAGDGGKMGFWLDDHAQQHIAIFDHGWPYVLTPDPLKALAFLAIGYPEPAALTKATMTASEAAEYDGADAPLIPTMFGDFLTGEFGIDIPKRASELGLRVPDDDEDDPMRRWIKRISDQ